jgi:hypothetical protein
MSFAFRGAASRSRADSHVPSVDSRCPSNSRDRIGRSRCTAEHCRAVPRCSPAHRGDGAVDPTRLAVVAHPRRGSHRRKYLGVSRNRPDVRGYTKRAPEVSPRTSTATRSRREHESCSRAGPQTWARGAWRCVKPWGERPTLFPEMLRPTRFLAITDAPRLAWIGVNVDSSTVPIHRPSRSVVARGR